MKLGRILYLIGIIGMAFMGYVMQKNGWNFMATMMAIMVIAGLVSYWEFVELNPITQPSSHRTRIRRRQKRAENWKQMTKDQQEFYLDSIENELLEAQKDNN